jgi:fructose-1,6-bisphosphatase/inositol monophosphatase family enzyme
MNQSDLPANQATPAHVAQPEIGALLAPLRRLHDQARDVITAACERTALEELARVDDDTAEGDTIYTVDRVGEASLVELFEREIAGIAPLVLISEGLPGGRIVLPRGATESDAVWRVIVDPIDGTRGLMYQKRSAWILTGVAPNCGRKTNLQDIKLAVQTEIPLVKQHLCDQLWAIRGAGAQAERLNRLNGERKPLRLRPSGARSIRHGFAGLARFFPGAREELAAIDEEIVRGALGEVEPGKAHCFEDQYLSKRAEADSSRLHCHSRHRQLLGRGARTLPRAKTGASESRHRHDHRHRGIGRTRHDARPGDYRRHQERRSCLPQARRVRHNRGREAGGFTDSGGRSPGRYTQHPQTEISDKGRANDRSRSPT